MPCHEETPGGGRPRREDDLDAVLGRLTAELLGRSHLMRAVDLADALAELAAPLGVSAVAIYIADLQQRELAPLQPEGSGRAGALPVDSTLAGRAYQSITIQLAPASGPDAAPPGRYQAWIPLIDGTERLGVLRLTVADVGDAMLGRYRAIASLVAVLIMAKARYSDSSAKAQRRRQMALQAELVWGYLPPRTFATERVMVAASLEPAYDAGGDAYDYSLLDDHVHVSVFDALGHDLSAGMLASVCVASCRSTRRAGGSLADIAARADDTIAGFFGDDRFVTALVCDLDLRTGLLTWIPCGHPPPLLVRGSRTVRELARAPRPPLGLAGLHHRSRKPTAASQAAASACTERLEPGDRVLLYTDGVTEGRAADGTPFGLRRLADFIVRHSSASLPAPETMRRLTTRSSSTPAAACATTRPPS